MDTASTEKGPPACGVALIGIDIGSSSMKAAAFDLDGVCLASSSEDLPAVLTQKGWVERDAEACWAAAVRVIRDVVGRLDRPVAAIGVTGCGNGAVFIDASGQPTGLGILSSDTRAASEIKQAVADLHQPYAGQTRCLLQWLRKSDDDRARAMTTVLFWKDFIRLRLTGVVSTDVTDAGAAGLMDIRTRDYFESDPAYPPLAESSAIGGYVTPSAAYETGLGAGLPVCVGCVDFEAAAIGSGLGGPGLLSVVAGSWSINQAYVEAPLGRQVRGVFLVNASTDPQRCLILEGSPTSANHFDWAVRRLAGHTDFPAAADEAETVEAQGVTFLPGLFDARAAFVGISVADGVGTMLRAVMEGIAFAHRRHVEDLKARDIPVLKVRLAGGATSSRFWVQMFADILETTVETLAVAEIGALGAAILAGVATGRFSSLSHGQDRMVAVGESFTPAKSYEPAYRRFIQVSEALA